MTSPIWFNDETRRAARVRAKKRAQRAQSPTSWGWGVDAATGRRIPVDPGMDRRRSLLTSLAATLTATIGVLAATRLTEAVQGAIRDGLREHGYVEGRDMVIE